VKHIQWYGQRSPQRERLSWGRGCGRCHGRPAGLCVGVKAATGVAATATAVTQLLSTAPVVASSATRGAEVLRLLSAPTPSRGVCGRISGDGNTDFRHPALRPIRAGTRLPSLVPFRYSASAVAPPPPRPRAGRHSELPVYTWDVFRTRCCAASAAEGRQSGISPRAATVLAAFRRGTTIGELAAALSPLPLGVPGGGCHWRRRYQICDCGCGGSDAPPHSTTRRLGRSSARFTREIL